MDQFQTSFFFSFFGYVLPAVEALEALNKVYRPMGCALCDERDGQPR